MLKTISLISLTDLLLSPLITLITANHHALNFRQAFIRCIAEKKKKEKKKKKKKKTKILPSINQSLQRSLQRVILQCTGIVCRFTRVPPSFCMS